MPDNSLVKVEGLTKPATVLIEKISDAVGGIFRPYQIMRVARAEAEAEVTRAEAEIQVTDLHRRALHRFLDEEAKKQSNMEEITQKALPNLKEDAKPEEVEDDWITNFFDKCRIISDSDMQQLWARLLAGQANSPGTFSKRTVNLLSDLEKSDAELFLQLCGFVWQINDDLVPLVFDAKDKVYNNYGINFAALSHLESLGLIQIQPLSGFEITELPKNIVASYYGRLIEPKFPKESNNLDVGEVLLTRAGNEFASICGASPVEGFFDFVYDRWAGWSLVPKREIEKEVPADS